MQSQSPGRLEGWDPLSPPPTPASPTPQIAVNVTLGAVGKPRVSPGLTTACIADAARKSRSASVFPEMTPCFDFVTFITARVPRPRISPCNKVFAPPPPPSFPIPATATDRINPGGGRSRNTGAINIPVQPGDSSRAAPPHPPSSEPSTSGHCGAAGRCPAEEGADFICNRGLPSPSSSETP